MRWRMLMRALILLAVAGTALAQTPESALSDTDQAHYATARALVAAYGENAWPGFGADVPPLLVRTAEREYLIGHPAPPEEFTLVADLAPAGAPMYVLDGHITPAPMASSWPVGAVWAAAIPVRDDLQALVDAQLGPDIVRLDDATYVRVLVHEMFHAYQFNTLGGPQNLPVNLMGPSSMDWAADLDLDALNAAHAAEGAALRAALEAESEKEAHAHAAEFVQLRADRRAGQPPGQLADHRTDLIAFERSVEWAEGPANYAGLAIMLHANELGSGALLAPVIFHAPDAEWAEFLDQLADPGALPGGLRERYTTMGAGQAFVLDRLLPGWQSRVLEDGTALDDLLATVIMSGK